MSAKTIYDRLRSHGMTVAGACAMLGNMQAESGLKANIAQRGMTTLTDDEYTRQADSYAISQAKFVHESPLKTSQLNHKDFVGNVYEQVQQHVRVYYRLCRHLSVEGVDT